MSVTVGLWRGECRHCGRTVVRKAPITATVGHDGVRLRCGCGKTVWTETRANPEDVEVSA
jgi:hypothetical protein